MAHLSLTFLGHFSVARDGQPVTTFESAKVRALLAYLAVHSDRPHARAELANLLWPDLPGETARTYLRHVLGKLKEAIADPTDDPSFLLVTRETVQLNPAADVTLDLATFTALLTACDTHPHRQRETCASCARRREQAAALYRGDFLTGFILSDSAAFEEWATLKRENLRQQVLGALARLAAYNVHRGAYAAAQPYAARMVEMDPWDEQARRQLMAILWHDGQRGAALAEYMACCRALRQELGVEPEAETTALYERIRDSPPQAQPMAMAASYHTLPAPTTHFVGREGELQHLGDLLQQPSCRLLTLTGPGGIGKTRLALEAAREALATFRDGVHFVSLAPLTTPSLIVPTLATALDITLNGASEPLTQLLRYLHDKELLIVLDNFEHLRGGAGLLTALLERAPRLVLLVTSRKRLHLQSEWVVELAGLHYPATDEAVGVESYDAGRLFFGAARRSDVSYNSMAEDAQWVGQICRLVEGMPLAIELAAAWVRVLSCEEIATEIVRSLDVLSGSQQDLPERHRSIRGVLDHSWHLLTVEQQRILRRLSVFRGGFDREAALIIAGASPAQLAELIDSSVLRRASGGRFNLHELVLQYAGERLRRAGEADTLSQEHATYYVQLATEAYRPILHGPDQAAWLTRLADEIDNLRAALSWCLVEPDRAELGLRLAGALGCFWQFSGHFHEGLAWFERMLARPDSAVGPSPGRARALTEAGWLAHYVQNYARADQLLEKSLKIYREMRDQSGSAFALVGRAACAHAIGDYSPAYRYAEEALALARDSGDIFSTYHALQALGYVMLAQGHRRRAFQCLEEGLALARPAGNTHATAAILCQMGHVAYADGDDRRATELYLESLGLFRAMGYDGAIASLLLALGNTARHRGDLPRAAELYRESLALGQQHGHMGWTAHALAALAILTACQPYEPGCARLAAQLFGVVDNLRAYLDASLISFAHPFARADYDRALAAAREQLDAAEWAVAWAEGKLMPLEQAVRCCLETRDGSR